MKHVARNIFCLSVIFLIPIINMNEGPSTAWASDQGNPPEVTASPSKSIIGLTGSVGRGGQGGGGGDGGLGSTTTAHPNGYPGTIGDQGGNGGIGGQGGDALWVFMNFPGGTYVNAGSVVLGGLSGQSGSIGLMGASSGGSGGRGGGVLSNGLNGNEPSPDLWSDQNGGNRGTLPSGTGGGGWSGGGGGGGGGSAPFFGGGSGGIGGDGVRGDDGSGGSGSPGGFWTEVTQEPLTNYDTIQVGGNGGQGGRGGQGGSGGGGGHGEYWGTALGYGASGGSRGSWGFGGAGGPPGNGELQVNDGADFLNQGQLRVGRLRPIEDAGMGTMSVNSGGRFENRSSLEIAPMTAGSLLIDGGVFVNGSSGVMDVGENTISLMLTNGGLFENSGEINVPNSIIFHIDGEADFVNSGILRGGEYQIGLGSTFTNNGVITDEAFFQNQGTYTGTGDFSGYFTGGRVHPGNPIGTMFFDANGSIWPLQIEFAKNESKEIIHDSVTWIGYCNVSGTIVEPTFTEGMSEDDLVDGASFEILSCEADPGEYFMVTLDHSTAPLEFGDWGLDLDYDLQSRELIVYLTYEIDTTDIDTPLLPESFALRGAYPNPFNPSTTIAYDLPTAVPVKLHVYDIAGRVVRVLRDGSVELPGSHKVVWNGQDDAGRTVSSGTYFCRLIAGEYVQIRSLMLVR